MRNIIFDKYLQKSNNEFSLEKREIETEMINYNTNINLYRVHNNFVFSSKYCSYLNENNIKIKYYYFAINKIKSNDYFKFYDYTCSGVLKILTYYKESSDSLIFVVQYKEKIKYFTLIGIKDIFSIISYSRVYNISSNTQAIYDISNLMEGSEDELFSCPASLDDKDRL